MTNRSALIATWRKFGMTEEQIADGLEQHALRLPGTLENPAPFPKGQEDRCIREMVAQMKLLKKMLPVCGRQIEQLMDEAERDINSAN